MVAEEIVMTIWTVLAFVAVVALTLEAWALLVWTRRSGRTTNSVALGLIGSATFSLLAATFVFALTRALA